MNQFPVSFDQQLEGLHASVLADACGTLLFPALSADTPPVPRVTKRHVWVDCTLGLGGHTIQFISSFLLNNNNFKDDLLECVLIDQDNQSLSLAQKRIEALLSTASAELRKKIKLHFIQDNFCYFDKIMNNIEPNLKFDLLLADLGVSSPQLDQASRGFSVSKEGPLDMRMNASSADTPTAWQILNEYQENELAQIFFTYAQEPRARKLARAIVEDRAKNRLTNSTQAFAAFTERVLAYGRSRSSPAYRIFQALRIQVNDELQSARLLLGALPSFAAPGARCGVITFHSLEDALVKKQMRAWEKGKKTWQDDEEAGALHGPLAPYTPKMRGWGKETPRGGVTASEQELAANSRSRSARLRVFCYDKEFNESWMTQTEAHSQ